MFGVSSFDIGIVAFSKYDEKHLLVTPDVPGLDGKEGAAGAEVLHPYGHLGRPLDPKRDDGGEISEGCSLLYARHGDEMVAIPVVDPRVTALLPSIKKGGSISYGAATTTDGTLEGASYVLFDGVDPNKVGRAGSLIAGVRAAGGKSHVLALNVRLEGKEYCELTHMKGHGLTLGQDGVAKLSNENGKCWLAIGPDGNVLAGKTKIQGSLSVGDPSTAQAVVKGPELVALLTQLISIVAAITAVTPGAPAAALASQLPGLLTKHLKAT